MKNFKILIIEDDPTTCTLLKTTLEMEGYQIAFVHNIDNDDVISLLNIYQPQLLFLDFHLGTRETLEHISTIRHHPNWQYLPVLMTSAIDHSRECLAVGATGFLLKPFNWDEIIDQVNQIHTQILHKQV
jgi:DNA-binding response OmpR family regulator